MMTKRFVVLMLGAVLFAEWGFAEGQDAAPAPLQPPTPAEQAICTQYNVSSFCFALVQELHAKTLETTGATGLDTQFMDLTGFQQQYFQTAYLAYIQGQVTSGAEELAKQAAIQLLSTTANVNQAGGNASSGGSTNLVSKPTTPDFLSMASESGAFTDTINGTTVTLQANADGLLKFLSKQPLFAQWDNAYAYQLQPLNFAVTLNVAQTGSGTATATTGSATASTPSISQILLPSNNASFSSFTASYQIYRKYNPQSSDTQKAWNDARAKHLSDFTALNAKVAAAANAWLKALQSGAWPQDLLNLQTVWHTKGKAAEASGQFEDLVAAFAPYMNSASQYLISTLNSQQNLIVLNQAMLAYRAMSQELITEARGKPLASLSYSYSALPDKPATHMVKGEGAYVFKGGHRVNGKNDGTKTYSSGTQLTGNVAAEWYAVRPTDAKYGTLRDFQAALEYDKPFGKKVDAPLGTWSLSGYGQYQWDPTVLTITAGNLAPGTNITLPNDAQVLLGTSGWLGVAQGKLTINLSQGLSLPIALKWSNKTDLLGSQDIRGQFGLSYDLSALSKLLTSK